jgi:glycosyltransferase involved in cell wall biosynthesis
MKFRIMNGLGRRGLLPPMDLLLGKGIYLFGNYFNWPLTRRSRSVTYIHDICFKTHPELVQPDNQRMLAKNVPRYIGQTDYAIAVSETGRKNLIKEFGVDPKKVVTVYNAIYDNLYGAKYSRSDIERVQKKYGVKGEKYFYFIGNIEPRKNLERLLQALMTLPKEYGIVMIGSDGWLNEKVFDLIDQANKEGRKFIKPKTYVDDEDSARLMHGAVGFVWPSIDEGFGIPPLEGLAANKPTIVADIPLFHEVVADAGIYCDPLSVDSIAAALNRVIKMSTKEREQLAKKGQAQVKKFSWARSAQQMATLLEKIDAELR